MLSLLLISPKPQKYEDKNMQCIKQYAEPVIKNSLPKNRFESIQLRKNYISDKFCKYIRSFDSSSDFSRIKKRLSDFSKTLQEEN